MCLSNVDIQDFVMVANECLDSRIRFGEPGVLCNWIWRILMIMLVGSFCYIC
jgi:hypothetical protein